ncbi:hypothetical protein BDR07DRAFT_1436811 [Suillus spraguei]|nr:hypothetical protein BDR07DRAFT_1436811 [Suillus spraguei]
MLWNAPILCHARIMHKFLISLGCLILTAISRAGRCQSLHVIRSVSPGETEPVDTVLRYIVRLGHYRWRIQ